jgi:ribosomal protein S18 acetylase RimI-like enzyme
MTAVARPRLSGLVIRPFDPGADFGPVASFIGETNRHDDGDWFPSAAVLANEWQRSERFDPVRDAIVATVDGAIVGVADTSWRGRGEIVSHHVNTVVHPAVRRRGLGRELLGRIEARARDAAREAASTSDRRHSLDAFFELQVPGAKPFVRATGFKPHTFGYVMIRPLTERIDDAPLPAGLDVRPVRPDDHRQIWEADVEAFLDHAQPAERDEGDFVRWFGQPELDTSLWQVAWAGDEVAGSVMTMIWRNENAALGVRRAWLEHVSVRRPWRRQGLASALIVETLRMLQAAGFEEAMLGVHGENPTGALGVYEKVGFIVHRRWAMWRKPLLPGSIT